MRLISKLFAVLSLLGVLAVGVPALAATTATCSRLDQLYHRCPTATIDAASLTSGTSTPTISGTASNIKQPFGIAISNSGGRVYGSGNLSVKDSRWKVKVTPPLANGAYTVGVYSNNVLLTSAALTINVAGTTTPPPPPPPPPATTTPTTTPPTPTGSIVAAVSSTPVAQNIVSGSSSIVLGRITLDASNSSENVSFTTINLLYTDNAPTDPVNCQLADGSTVLTTGAHVVNPSGSGDKPFVLDVPLVVAKGTVKTIDVQCTVSSGSAAGSFSWGLSAAGGVATFSGVGAVSNKVVNPSATMSVGNTMTILASPGSFTFGVDTAATPAYSIAPGGVTGVTMGVYKLHATGENISINKIALVLSGGVPGDVQQVYLYNGSTLLGGATFVGNSKTATSTLNTPLLLTNGVDTQVVVRADLAPVGASQTGVAGDLIKIEPSAAQGAGMSSGATISAAGSPGVVGVRLFSTYPIVSIDTLSNNGVMDGRLMRFKVTASASGDLGIAQLVFALQASGASVTNPALYAYADSAYSMPVAAFMSGKVGNLTSFGGALLGVSLASPLEIPAGSTYYFEARATVALLPSNTTGQVAILTTLNGDTAYRPLSSVGTSTVTNAVGQNFVWSPNDGTIASYATADWTNGYGVAGLPVSGVNQNRVTMVQSASMAASVFEAVGTALQTAWTAYISLFGY